MLVSYETSSASSVSYGDQMIRNIFFYFMNTVVSMATEKKPKINTQKSSPPDSFEASAKRTSVIWETGDTKQNLDLIIILVIMTTIRGNP